MQFDLERVRRNVRQASTEDLLDRVTVYRVGMEPAALAVIEQELDQRGLTLEQIAEHEQRRREQIILRPDGSVQPCSRCSRPAVTAGWGWHRVWGRVPLFPRWFAYCDEHDPQRQNPSREGEAPAEPL